MVAAFLAHDIRRVGEQILAVQLLGNLPVDLREAALPQPSRGSSPSGWNPHAGERVPRAPRRVWVVS